MSRARVSWDQYFMNIAREVSTRSTCDRKFVGAVIARDKSILATGYNGSIRGLPHCDDEGHLMEDGHCVRTVHAEANAIAQAARHGARIEGAAIYVTASPCWGCFRLIANAGIDRICFGEFYRDPRIFDVATRLGIELVDMSDGTSAEGGVVKQDGRTSAEGGVVKQDGRTSAEGGVVKRRDAPSEPGPKAVP